MMSLHHSWEWQPHKTASHIHIRHKQSVWAHWYDVHGHTVAALHRYSHYFAQILVFWVTCGVKMMSLRHSWGWRTPKTASCIHIRHVQSVWAHWYDVHGHRVGASNRYTHTIWVRYWGSGSLVESKWLRYCWRRQQPQSTFCIHIRHIQSVWAHWYDVHGHTPVAVLHSYTNTIWVRFWGSGSLVEWSQNDVITSWLRLTDS